MLIDRIQVRQSRSLPPALAGLARAIAIGAAIALLPSCGAASDEAKTAGAEGGATVHFEFPELSEGGDAKRYLLILFSAKDFAARNQTFELEAKRKVDATPVAAAEYDLNIELRNRSNKSLDKTTRAELAVSGDEATLSVKFADAEPIPLP
jgi:hypothetical protein